MQEFFAILFFFSIFNVKTRFPFDVSILLSMKNNSLKLINKLTQTIYFYFFKYFINILLANVNEADLLVAKYIFMLGIFLLIFSSFRVL